MSNVIAKTIHAQIKVLDPRALFAWGAKELAYTVDGFRFKSSGMVKTKCYVYITLDEGHDLYNVHFFKVRKGVHNTIKKVDGMYAEMLVDVINRVVG
jgi:hypothetical protein